jgi:hypothetical protein
MRPPRAIRNEKGRLQRVIPPGVRLDPATMEVFAWIGVAVVNAQAFERTLAAYLTLARPEAVTATRPQFRRYLRRANAMTMGALINSLEKLALPAIELETLREIGQTLKRRNFVTHHFIRKPSRRLMLVTDEGRAKLVLEAQRDIMNLGFWITTVTRYVVRHAVRLGDRSDHLHAHADWLQTVKEENDDLRIEARTALSVDPSLAIQIGEMMEDIEQVSTMRRALTDTIDACDKRQLPIALRGVLRASLSM